LAIEIERKFLVRTGWKPTGSGTFYKQGYVTTPEHGATVRVRIAGDKAFITIKGPAVGLSRLEFEYEIPVADAHLMLAELTIGTVIEKIRYPITYAGHRWEVDVFQGCNSGLIVAEVELASPDAHLVLPDWIAEEISHDHRYHNVYLSQHPWSEWRNEKASGEHKT